MSTTTQDPPAEAEAEAEASAEAKAPPTDWSAVMTSALVEASLKWDPAEASLPDSVVSTLQEQVRKIPSAARGSAQGAALKAVLVDGNDAALEAILDAINSIPKAAGKPRVVREPKPGVSPVDDLAIRISGALVAYAHMSGIAELGEEASSLAQEWYQNGLPEDKPEYRDLVVTFAEKAVRGLTSKGRGRATQSVSSGERTSYSETLEDLIKDGRISTPLNLYGGTSTDATAKVLKSGKVRVGDRDFDNVSGAAKFAKDPAAFDAKNSKVSLNGWDWFSFKAEDGTMQRLGSLRKS